MNKSSEVKSQKRGLDKGWKITLITLGVIVATIFALWGVAEYRYQQRINKLSAAVDQVERDYIQPDGGVLHVFNVKAPHYLDSSCVDNGPCPTVTKVWLVPIAKGQEGSLITSILKGAGYNGGLTDPAIGGGVKNGVGLNIEARPVEGGSYAVPHPISADKEWAWVSVNAQEPWKK